MATEVGSSLFAFVLMPFDADFEPIYRDLIVPALEDAGYEVRRADSVLDQQNIMRDIIDNIATADLIVAEISTLNPNVMCELGIAHGLQRPTVMLTQQISSVPFDLRSYRIITYSENFREVGKLQARLREIATLHREGKVTFGSPVSDFAPGVTPSSEEQAVLAIARQDSSVISAAVSIDEELGFLDIQAELERAQEEITRHYGRT